MSKKRNLVKLVIFGAVCLSPLASCSKKTAPAGSSSSSVTEASSSSTVLPAYDMSGVAFPDVSAVYDGKEHKAEIKGTLPSGVTVSYENNTLTDAGEEEAVAKFQGDSDHQPIPDRKAKLEVSKAAAEVDGLVFSDQSFPYDGKPHSLEVEGLLHTGMTFSYSIEDTNGNPVSKAIEIGTYTVTAKAVDTLGNHKESILSAKLTITSGEFSGIGFQDCAYTYDGLPHSLAVSGNLPSSVNVSYDVKDIVDAGEYMVTATLTDSYERYKETTMKAKLTILKANYDLSGISFANQNYIYDGKPHALTVQGTLPEGVSVSYSKDAVLTNVGTETVTASFSGDLINHNPIQDRTASITISQAVISGITFPSSSYTYDGLPHSLAVEGTLPEGVSVSYDVKDKVDVGSYAVTACLSDLAGNYVAEEMTAVLTITKATFDIADVRFEDASFEYDRKAHEVTITGTLPEGVTVLYKDNSRTLPGIQTATASFQVNQNFNPITETLTASLLVTSASSNFSVVSTGDSTCALTGISGGFEENIYLPSAIQGKALTEIRSSLGEQYGSIMEIPKSIRIPDTVLSIQEGSFSSLTNLTSITVSDGNPNYKSIDGVLFSKDGSELIAYPAKKSSTYVIPSSVTKISGSAFSKSSLSMVDIPDGVLSIGEKAFVNSLLLSTLSLGAGLTAVPASAFMNCPLLSDISVSSSNLYLESQDGILFTKNQKKLLLYPSNKVSSSYLVPSTVTEIGENAFFDIGIQLDSLVFQDGLQIIGKGNFTLCKISCLMIPSSVTEFGGSFLGCDSSTSVYCRVESKPVGWDSQWMGGSANVYWYSETSNTDGSHWHYVNGVPSVWTE